MIQTYYDIPAYTYYHVVKKSTVLALWAVCVQPSCIPEEDFEKLSPSMVFLVDTLKQIITRGQVIRDKIVCKMKYKKIGDGVELDGRLTGRVMVSNTPNLVSLALYSKGTLLYDHYINLDIINYHASVLLSLCRQLGIDCPLVETYVYSRDYWLELVKKRYNVEKKDAKLLFSVLLTVGSFHSWKMQCKITAGEIKEVRAFREEVEDVTERVVLQFPQYGSIVRTKGKSNLNCLISFIVRDYENAILELVLKNYSNVRRGIVLNGDGIYILKEEYHDNMEKEIEAIVKKELGLEITVTKKEIEHVDLSGVPYERILHECVEDYKDLLAEDLDYVENMEEGALAMDVVKKIRTFEGYCACVRSHKLRRNEVFVCQKCLALHEKLNVPYETLFSSSMAFANSRVCSKQMTHAPNHTQTQLDP